MGTSNPYGGPGGQNPLVPTWLGSESDGMDGGAPPNSAPAIPAGQAPPASPIPNRFTAARNNFTRFVSSGGSDRASLGRAVAGYVSRSSGGARRAAQRMGSSRGAGARLLGFLSDAQAHGEREALRTLNLGHLAGRPIEEIFLGLVDYVCPDGGTIDEGISREAFVETIVDLSELGITDLNTLTTDQMQTVFELFATHSIEARLCNDIGTKAIILPGNAHTASRVQAQLRDFIARGVSDALSIVRVEPGTLLTSERVLGFVDRVYEDAFRILQSIGEAEAEK